MKELAIQTYLRGGKELRNLYQQYEINAVPDDTLGLVVLDYRVLSPMDTPLVQESRGLVLKTADWSVAGKSINAFFEPQTALGQAVLKDFDWETAYAMPKHDGALVMLYCFEGVWQVATRVSPTGKDFVWSVNSNGARLTWRDLVEKTFEDAGTTFEQFTAKLDPQLYYTFEVCSPENRVLVIYRDRKLTLVAAVSSETLDEVDIYSLKDFPGEVSQRVPVKSMEDVWTLISQNPEPYKTEGFVVVDGEFRRLKMRNPAYVQAMKEIDSETDSDLLRELRVVQFLGLTLTTTVTTTETTTVTDSSTSSSSSCLAAGTVLARPSNRNTNIEKLRLGDILSGRTGNQIIAQIRKFEGQNIIKVVCQNGSVRCSETHPWKLLDGTVLSANELKAGMILDGNSTIESVAPDGVDDVYMIIAQPHHELVIVDQALHVSDDSIGDSASSPRRFELYAMDTGTKTQTSLQTDPQLGAMNFGVVTPINQVLFSSGAGTPNLPSVLTKVMIVARGVATAYASGDEQWLKYMEDIWPTAVQKMREGKNMTDVLDESSEAELMNVIKAFEDRQMHDASQGAAGEVENKEVVETSHEEPSS